MESKIPLDVLRNVKTIVTHAHCPDGLASAILLHDVLPKAEIIFATHDQLDTLPATEGMLFCDIGPPWNRVTEFLQVKAVVLDHHRSAEPTVIIFKHHGLGVFADEQAEPGVSGAVLAFRHVWLPLHRERRPDIIIGSRVNEERARNAKNFAMLIGIRDTFDKRNTNLWHQAWDLSAGMMFQPPEKFLSFSDAFESDEWNEWFFDTGRLGEAVSVRNQYEANRAAAEGFKLTTRGGKTVLITQGLEFTTLLGDMGVADLVVGFQYRCDEKTGEPRFQVSMRSQGVVDVASIAKIYDGGGHTNAAGFTLNRLSGGNPIWWIENMLRDVAKI